MAVESNRVGRRARACPSSRRDRISNLPDPIAHQILSFLGIKDVISFGCVSKACREFSLTTPSLNIYGFSDVHLPASVKRFNLSALDRHLLIHRGLEKMHRFRVVYQDQCIDEAVSTRKDVCFRIMTWIHNAVRCKVEVLEVDVSVDMSSGDRYLLPPSVLLCGSLRSLLFRMQCKIRKAPPLDSFSNLEYLKLDNVHIEDERFFKWISGSCICIKELHLVEVYGIKNITIESSSLKVFSFSPDYLWIGGMHLTLSGEKLEDIIINWDSHSARKGLLNIVAPNLKYLKWSGTLLARQNLGKRLCLEKAEFSLCPELDDFNIMSEVLRSICRVEVLILNKRITMALFMGCFMPGVLENVCYLCIHMESWLDTFVLEMVSSFGRMLNLSTLVIKSDLLLVRPTTDCSGIDMGYWRFQNISFIGQLKEVTIELSNGSNGIEFAKFILESAQNLKKMLIVHSLQHTHAMTELKKSKMASNDVTLDFEEDQRRGSSNCLTRRAYWFN